MEKENMTPRLRFPGFSGEWEERKVGDIAEKTYGGGTPKTNVDEYWGGSIPWIQSSNLTEHQLFDAGVQKYITEIGLQKSATQLVPKNSIAVVSHVGVGKLVFLPFEYTTSQDFISLSGLTTDPIFACYALYKKLQENVHIVQGSAIKGITKDVLLNKEIPVPGKDEQKAVGTFLQSIDTLITLQQRKLDGIKEYKSGMLQKMFPKDGERVPEIRFPGFAGDWEQRKFGDITELKSASRVHREEWTSEGVPFYRSSDVMSAINGTQNEKAFISEELYEKLSSVSGKLEEGDVLVTGGGSVGNPYIVPDNKPLYTKDADLLWIKNQGRFDAYFIYEFFFSPTFRAYLGSVSHVGTIAHYTIIQLSDTPIALPSLDEQKCIGDYFRRLDNLITLHQRKLDEMKEYKKGLLQQMFV